MLRDRRSLRSVLDAGRIALMLWFQKTVPGVSFFAMMAMDGKQERDIEGIDVMPCGDVCNPSNSVPFFCLIIPSLSANMELWK